MACHVGSLVRSLMLGLLAGMSTAAAAQETSAPASSAPTEATEKAIRQSASDFSTAFKQQDAQAIAELWTPDGVYVDEEGVQHVGREAIQQLYQAFFAANDPLEMQIHIDSMRQVTDDVIVEQGTAKLVPAPLGAPAAGKYVAIHVKQDDGKWLMDSVRDSSVDIPTTYDRLVHLEMLVGDWAADHNDAQISLSSDWNPTKTFLERRFVVTHDGQQSTSTEIIGWDPSTGQVTSWTFSDDGSHNVGHWTALEDGWVVRNRGITAAGVPTTSTDFWAPLLDDALGWRSTQRTAGGATVADPQAVVLKKPTSDTQN